MTVNFERQIASEDMDWLNMHRFPHYRIIKQLLCKYNFLVFIFYIKFYFTVIFLITATYFYTNILLHPQHQKEAL